MGCSCLFCVWRFTLQIPRYCKPEPWEFEQMMKVATGKVQPFERCSVSLQFEVKSLEMEGKIVLSDQQSVLKKYSTLKRFEYVSPWHDEDCKDKNKVHDGMSFHVDCLV